MLFVYAPAVAIREGDIITIASAPSAKKWGNLDRMSSYPKVTGSNPVPATNQSKGLRATGAILFFHVTNLCPRHLIDR